MQYSSGMKSPRDFQLVNEVDCWVPPALLKAIVWAFLATKSFVAGSSMHPCHVCYASQVSPEGRHIFERLLGFHVHKVVHDGTALTCDFLVEQGSRSQYWNEMGLLRNVLHVNNKKNLVLVGAYVGSCT
jgi:hypothetical protein